MVESIAAMSMNLSAAKLQQDASLAMVKKVMDDQAMSVQNLMEMADAATATLSSDGQLHAIDTLA